MQNIATKALIRLVTRGRYGVLAQDLGRAKRLLNPKSSKFDLLATFVFLAPKLLRGRTGEIFTHLTMDEQLVLFLLANNLGLKAVVVEVGSFLGASATHLARGIRGRGRVYCVDTWNNDAMDEPQRDTYEEFVRNVADLRHVIVPLRGKSQDIACEFDRRIDLLFIDGDHSYEACLGDWCSWSPFLKKGAIAVLHDSGWAEGVQRVIKDKVSPGAKRELHLPNMYVAWV